MIELMIKTTIASIFAGVLIGYFMGYLNLLFCWLDNKSTKNPMDDAVFIKIAKDLPMYPFNDFVKFLKRKQP